MKTIVTFVLLVGLTFTSCEKDIPRYMEMRKYHQESTTLAETSLDSISRFSQKVDGFVCLHPSAKEDPLYPEIEENIWQARLIVHLNGETWGEDIHVEFDFGEGADKN